MKIIASERKTQGTSASRRLRHAGKVPGIVYGHGDALPIELDHNDLWHAMRKESLISSVLDLDLNGKITKVVIRDVQYHAYKPFITHIDLQRVNMKQAITMRVPLRYSGSEESPAVKTEGQMVNYVTDEIEIECLPADLPEFIAVDLSKLEKDGVIHISDITLPKGVTAIVHTEESPALVTAVSQDNSSDEAVEAASSTEQPAAAS